MCLIKSLLDARQKRWKMRKKVLLGLSFFTLTIVLSFIGYLFIIYAGNYVIDEKKLVMNSATTLVDQDGKTVTKLFLENRDLVSIENIPKHVQEAFIAVEDTRFYEHHGIDVRAILRAIYRDLLAGAKVEGGSTITQQLAKNVYLSNEKTWFRKTKEVMIALNLEKRYSKQKLLEMYVNQIYFGHGVYGVQAASKFFFNKDVSELTVEQAALLAAIPKSPTKYSPILHPERSAERRNVVINLMEARGFLSPEEAVRLQGRTLGLHVQPRSKGPDLLSYIDLVMKEAEEKYSISNEELLKGGYTITVPMNKKLQHTAYELFQQTRFFPGKDDKVEGAFVLMDNNTGGVLACIGGRKYIQKGIHRVMVKRQPGSTFKPLAVYGPALEEKFFRPYSILVDKQLTYGTYEPKNYNGVYRTEITMYDAIVDSSNAPAVWALNAMGVNTGKKYLGKLGITIPDNGLAIALGGLQQGVSPFDLMKAYRAFPQNGKVIEPYFIEKIVDRHGEVLAKASPEENQVFSPQTSWYMTRMLEAVVRNGTGKNGIYMGALVGKTGTTSYLGVKGAVKDAWFAGFTPDVTGVLWMGYDKTDEKHYLTGGSPYPTKLFKQILEHSDLDKHLSFKKPKGLDELEPPIRLKEINNLTAKLSFQPIGLFTITLNWTPADDRRIVYRIYEKMGDKLLPIGSVTGKGRYQIQYVNLFSKLEFVVIPFNPQTKREGKPSNTAAAEFFEFQ
jgi:penicillin-binding protein 2A